MNRFNKVVRKNDQVKDSVGVDGKTHTVGELSNNVRLHPQNNT